VLVYFCLLFFFFLGLIFGSFANVLVDREVKKESLWGFSHCDHCQKQLKWYDNIPLISFFLLLGKCRFCKKKISFQYPLVEFSMGLVFLIITIKFFSLDFSSGYSFGSQLLLIHYLFVGFLFVVISVWDLKYMIIPNKLILVGFLTTAIFYFFIFWLTGEGECPLWSLGGCSLWSNLEGALVGSGFFGGLFLVSKGKWIGGGDIKLGAWLGLLVGLKGIYPWLTISYILGALVSIFLLAEKKKKMKSEIPFGPFLLAGAMLVLLFNENISQIIDYFFTI